MFQLFQTFIIQSIIYLTNAWLVYNMSQNYLEDQDQSALFLWLGIPIVGGVNYALARVIKEDDPKMGKHFKYSTIAILAIWLPLLYLLPNYY